MLLRWLFLKTFSFQALDNGQAGTQGILNCSSEYIPEVI